MGLVGLSFRLGLGDFGNFGVRPSAVAQWWRGDGHLGPMRTGTMPNGFDPGKQVRTAGHMV